MDPRPNIEELLKRHNAMEHVPLPHLSELRDSGAPAPRTIIVTCIDPRCVPEKFFNLDHGEVVVSRNAGGHVRKALQDISLLDTLFKLDEICIIHHTDCGTTHLADEQVRGSMKSFVDKENWAELDKMDFGEIFDLEASVKSDLEWVRKSPFIREDLKKGTKGFLFDIKTGEMKRINP